MARRTDDLWTAEETAFASNMVDRAMAEGKLTERVGKAAERVRRGAVRALRRARQADLARPMMAFGAGSRGGQDQFLRFEERFRPELDRAVGFGMGIGAFILSVFFSGLKSWLVSTIIRMLWDGAVNVFTATPEQAAKEWQPQQA